MAVKCICAADLNKRVDIWSLKSGLSPNAGGQIDETDTTKWRKVGSEWAQCKTTGSRETVIDNQVRQFASHEWTIRCTPRSRTYTTGMYLKMGSRQFFISEPPQIIDEQNRWIVFATTEVPAV